MTEIDCRQTHWGTVSGLDPELVHELRRAREAREVRESEAIDLDALEAAAKSQRKWTLARIAKALGLLDRERRK